MNYIFYQTKTKYTNAGDVLINKALINKLRLFGKLYANCSKEIPDEFLEKLGIMPEERFVTKSEKQFATSIIKFKRKHKKDNVYIFSGLGDSYGGGSKRVLRNMMSAGIYMLYKCFGIKTVRIGRSVGEYTKPMQFSEYFKSKFTDFNYLRDTDSLEKCKKMKFKNASFCPDMSWIYENGKSRDYNGGSNISIFMRAAVIGKYDPEVAKLIVEKLYVFLDKASDCIPNPHLIFAYQVKEDRRIALELYEHFDGQYDCEFVDEQLDLGTVESVYGKSAFHISNRLHSLLLGYKYGSLPIALLEQKKHYKVTSVFKDSGLDDLMFDLNDELDEKRIEKVCENRELYYNNVINKEKEYSGMVDEILNKEVFRLNGE